MQNPFRPAALAATVIAAISELPLALLFLALYVPGWVADKFIYAIPLMVLGAPGAAVVYGSTRAGFKFVPLIFVVNWAIYFVLAYLLCWLWLAAKYLRATRRMVVRDE